MSESIAAANLPESAAAEVAGLLRSAAASGHLSLDAVVHALKDVEFDPEIIEGVRQSCAAAGVVLDEEHESPVPPEISVPQRPDGSVVVAEVDLDAPPIDEARVARAAAFAATIGDDVEEPSTRRTRSRSRVSESGGSDDPVRLYLKEIGQVPLLDARQEVRVAARIKRGIDAR
ncbi:MAG: hypothetical protein GWP47_02410, partial [Actinobacteria bacterium]|nr:hypothetical protein [Actinomycetota bacterium]